jgi:amino acid transporter
LRRELGFLNTAALSVGVLAPTLAMSLTGVEPARIIGRAAPLAFVFAAVGVGFVCYGFVRLSGRVAHAGSVYGFAGSTLGPRAGFVPAWAMLGTYLVFPAVSISAIALFGQAFLKSTGLASSPPWLPIALVAWALIWFLVSRDIKVSTTSLLSFEVVSLALIVVLVVVIFAKLAGGDAPHGQTLNADFLKIPSGTSLSTVALAATFGFLSFAGFEAVGSLGEESHRPRRAIPRAIVTAVIIGGVFYVACMVAQTLAFGTNAAGVKAFSGSEAPLADLAESYVGRGLADALEVAAMISALGAGLGCAAVSARMIFAMSRDGILPRGLSRLAPGTAAPARAVSVVMVFVGCGLVVFGAAGTPAIKVFFYFATMGVLSLLVMYMFTNVGAARLLAQTQPGWRRLEVVLPLVGIVVAGYVLYRNVWPVPDFPFNLFPYIVAGWLAVGIVLALALPAIAARPVPTAEPEPEMSGAAPNATLKRLHHTTAER